MSATTTIIRPEFQLKIAGVDFKSDTGIEVKAGTIFARLYYAPGCQTLGQSISGKTVVKLSDRINKGHRTIEFICVNPADYKLLHETCAKSNMAVCRTRTIELLERCLATDIPADIQAARAAAEADRVRRLCASISADPWDFEIEESTPATPVPPVPYQPCLPAAKTVINPEMQSVLESKTVKELRYIAKVYGVTVGHCNKAELIELLGRQFTRRNINPIQIRTCK